MDVRNLARNRTGGAQVRTEETVELPAICPVHQFCAFTGDEKDRCSICHSSKHLTDDHGDLPPGRTAPCLCDRCGELFTSKTPFGIHFRPNGKCGNPERRGLILVTKNGWLMWGKPGSRPDDI